MILGPLLIKSDTIDASFHVTYQKTLVDILAHCILWNFSSFPGHRNYRKTSNIRRNSVGNDIVDHPDAVGASPVGAAPTTSSF